MGEILLDRGPEGTDIDYQLPSEAVEDLRAKIGRPITVFTQTTELDAMVPDPDNSIEVIRRVTVRGILADVRPEEVVVFRPKDGEKTGGEEIVLPVSTASMDEGSADTPPFVGFKTINSVIIEDGEIFTFRSSR